MPPKKALLVASLLALLLSAGLFVGILLALDRPPTGPQIRETDRIRAAADYFGGGKHVYVAEDARRWLSPEDQAELEAAAAASPHPIFVMAWQDGDDGTQHFDAVLAVALKHNADGFYLLYNGPGYAWDEELGRTRTTAEIPSQLRGDGRLRLAEVIEQVASSPQEESFRTNRVELDSVREGEQAFGSKAGAFALGGLLGALASIVVVPLYFILEWTVRRARR